jgi:hypothetical protein
MILLLTVTLQLIPNKEPNKEVLQRSPILSESVIFVKVLRRNRIYDDKCGNLTSDTSKQGGKAHVYKCGT